MEKARCFCINDRKKSDAKTTCFFIFYDYFVFLFKITVDDIVSSRSVAD